MSFQKILRLLNEGDGEKALAECRVLLDQLGELNRRKKGGTTTETHDAGLRGTAKGV